MRIFWLILILILFFGILDKLYSGNISAPPVLKDEPVAEQHYLQEIYNNWQVLEVTTTAPNGNRRGATGSIVIYNNAGSFTLWVNSGSTTWQQI